MCSKTVFIQTIESHLEYLKEVQQSINSSGDYCGTNHLSCTMGKWMYGEGAEDVKKMGNNAEQIFQQLFEPHEEFHEVSSTSIKAFNNNNHELAKHSLTKMIFLSNKLTKLLLQLNEIAIEAEDLDDSH
ncbi:MAG: CZB domain-containing protein [Gammaproteobacteria bacterium]|nr:CZB domain-containing protein [Gammaproteobacteria bacterium]